MPGQFAQGGVGMRDCLKNRAGFDRVLMTVAATFLTVSATSALAAQSTTPRASAAELAIDAAVPRPEPANVPPPTVGDFKMDTTYKVRFEAVGNKFTTYVQDKLVDYWTDDQIKSGGAGFFTAPGERAQIRSSQIGYLSRTK